MKMKKLTNLRVFRLLALLLCLAATVPQLHADIIVAGNNSSLFGGNWTTSTNSSNQMKHLDGTNNYYLAKTNVSLSGTTEYKVVDNGSWYPSGGNLSFSANGTRSLVFIYNTSSHAVSLFGPFQYLTVAGSQTEVLGSSWGEADSHNDMTTTDGINYKLSFTDVNVTANTYSFKVTYDHSWSTSWPSSNKDYTVSFTGLADVEYTFNVVTKAVDVTVTQKSVTPVTPDYYVIGDIFPNGWNTGASTKMADDNNDGTYTWTSGLIHLNMGTNYEYKVLDSNGAYHPSGANATFNVSVPGTYTIEVTYDSSTGNVNAVPTLDTADPTYTYDIYVRYTGSEPVSNVFIYAWDAYGNLSAAWSGTALSTLTSQTINGHTYYHVAYTSYSSTINVIFNENGSSSTQTTDLTANPGNSYFTYGGGSSISGPNAQADLADQTYDIYVRYTGNQDVSNVYAYGWDAQNHETLGAWGGTKLSTMTSTVINGHTYYHVTLTSSNQTLNILFNENANNSTQTADLTINPGDSYFTYGGGSIISGPNAQADPADPTYDYTIYVRYKGNATPYMYLWEGTNTELLDAFPGQALTDNTVFNTETINGYTYYKYTVTGSHYPVLGMILNEDHDGQTSDLSVSPGTSYYTYGGGNTVSGPNNAADPAIVYYAESDFAGWTTDGTQMSANGDGSYSKTFTGVTLNKGTQYGYKVYGNDGTPEGVWIGDSNGNNATLTPDMSGTYTVTITLNSDGTLSHTLTMTAEATVYITGDGVLGGFSCDQGIAMTYTGNGIYTYATTLSDKATTQFVFADGQNADWTTFNNNYRIGPDNGNETYIINSGYTGTQKAGGDNGCYTVVAGAGALTFYFDAINMQYKVEGTVPPTLYYVLGNNADLFGAVWTESAAGRMTYDDQTGTYTWSASNVHLNGNGDYQFKVYGDNVSWYPADYNISLDVERNGIYNLTINFDGNNVTYALTLIEATSQGTYYITGSQGLGLGWSYAPETEMTFDASTGLYTYTTQVAEGGMYNFVFGNGQGNGWDDFNNNYRIGPASSNNQAITPDGNWNSTQMANGNDGSYSITVNPGTITFTLDPATMRFNVVADVLTHNYTFYVLPSDHQTVPYIYLWGLGTDEAYSNSYPGNQLTETEVLDDGNTWYKLSVNLTVEYIHALVNGGGSNADNTKTADITHIDPGTYYIYWTTTREPGDDYNDYFLTNVAPTAPGGTLYMIGTYYYNKEQYHYDSNQGVQLKYDANTQIYYLNNVNLAVHNTFCFTTQLSELSDDWSNVGTRYGNSGSNEHVAGDGVTNYFAIDENWINKAIALDEWSDDNGEYRMLVPGIYNVLVNLEEKWVKLIKTDYYELTPMNVFLEQTPNVIMSQDGNNFIQDPNTEYSTQIFGDGCWPLAAYNGTYGDGVWNPHDNGNKYPVTFIGDTTTVDGKQWWHWQVEASIAELFFTRLNEPCQSDTLRRKAGVLWVTWDEVNGQASLTDHSREYFEAAANALPSNVVVMEGHYYVYFINTVDWDQVYCYAWDNNQVTPDSIDNTFYDGYSRQMNIWPGQPCELIGIDPVTGYEVWRYDFGTIIGTDIPNGGILFNDGNTYSETEAKEQTGDFEYINGAVYDYLGMVDGAFTLNNLIRKGAKEVRYTLSNDLLGVYYDKDAVTRIEYKNEYDQTVHEDIVGALYAKDLNLYGEKSVMPDASYTDYVYDICASDHTPGRSQVMIKKTTYDQSNWVKLVISPNYDGGGAVVPREERPDLSKYVNHIIPAGSLDVFMTDSINPTAHVLRISMGDAMNYEPNVYVSEHFNDTVVFNYTHHDWLGADAEFPYAYSCQPEIIWEYDTIEDIVSVTGGRAIRKPNYSHPYKMFYVAPKPQEIAYITWVVYDNDNLDGTWQGYIHGQYSPYTRESVSEVCPEDPGRFYSPMNWNRMVYIDPAAYPELSQITEASELEKKLGAWSPEYGPFSNGYMQYGGFKVNWSLFDMEASGGPWWQIIKPGQAYKFKAIIRYARGSTYSGMEGEIDDTADNFYYGPSSGYYETDPNGNLTPGSGTVFNAPRRSSEESGYANMYFTDYDDLTESKFIIFPIEASSSESNGNDMGNVTSVREVITNVANARTVSSVRYYNLMGAESDKPFDGINIMVITFSDGSRTSRKILR